jgi:hypothetical protein
MIEDIERAVLDEDFNLTEWEEEFIESIKRQDSESLSDKQENVLTRIWHRSKGN